MIDESDADTPRWHLRFANFKAALATLCDGVMAYRGGDLPQLARDGLIQRFEYTWEMGWKLMRDYLLGSGITMPVVNPGNVIRSAFHAGLIADGDAWIMARRDRNVVSHEFGIDEAARVAEAISSTYLALLEQLEEKLEHERAAEIDLTKAQRAAIWAALAPHAGAIDLVGVYGSRVQGKARPGSDVDLVIYGSVSPRDVADLRFALEDGDLSIFADVIAYQGIEHAPLKAQIDHWMLPLFSKGDLIVAAAA